MIKSSVECSELVNGRYGLLKRMFEEIVKDMKNHFKDIGDGSDYIVEMTIREKKEKGA